jgi:hypothetical protein
MHPWKTSAPRFVYHDMVHVRFMPKSVCGPVVLSAYHRQNKSLMQVSHSCSDDGMGLCLYVQGLEWLWMTKGENQQWICFASEIWNLLLQQIAGRF